MAALTTATSSPTLQRHQDECTPKEQPNDPLKGVRPPSQELAPPQDGTVNAKLPGNCKKTVQETSKKVEKAKKVRQNDLPIEDQQHTLDLQALLTKQTPIFDEHLNNVLTRKEKLFELTTDKAAAFVTEFKNQSDLFVQEYRAFTGKKKSTKVIAHKLLDAPQIATEKRQALGIEIPANWNHVCLRANQVIWFNKITCASYAIIASMHTSQMVYENQWSKARNFKIKLTNTVQALKANTTTVMLTDKEIKDSKKTSQALVKTFEEASGGVVNLESNLKNAMVELQGLRVLLAEAEQEKNLAPELIDCSDAEWTEWLNSVKSANQFISDVHCALRGDWWLICSKFDDWAKQLSQTDTGLKELAKLTEVEEVAKVAKQLAPQESSWSSYLNPLSYVPQNFVPNTKAAYDLGLLPATHESPIKFNEAIFTPASASVAV